MTKRNKGDIRRAFDRAERGITRSIIRWKYKQEGRSLPPDDALEDQSKKVIGQAHRIIATRSRVVLNELRSVYEKPRDKKEGDSD